MRALAAALRAFSRIVALWRLRLWFVPPPRARAPPRFRTFVSRRSLGNIAHCLSPFNSARAVAFIFSYWFCLRFAFTARFLTSDVLVSKSTRFFAVVRAYAHARWRRAPRFGALVCTFFAAFLVHCLHLYVCHGTTFTPAFLHSHSLDTHLCIYTFILPFSFVFTGFLSRRHFIHLPFLAAVAGSSLTHCCDCVRYVTLCCAFRCLLCTGFSTLPFVPLCVPRTYHLSTAPLVHAHVRLWRTFTSHRVFCRICLHFCAFIR